MADAYERIYEYIRGLEVIDRHEHLPLLEAQRDRVTDVHKEYLTYYCCRDLVSAGLPHKDLERVQRMDDDIRTKWSIVAPFWEAARHTGYGRSLDIAVQQLYGIDRISGDTIEALDAKFRESLAPDGTWSTGGHTSTPVRLFAAGPGAEAFAGDLDNTDVPKRIADAIGIGPFPD